MNPTAVLPALASGARTSDIPPMDGFAPTRTIETYYAGPPVQVDEPAGLIAFGRGRFAKGHIYRVDQLLDAEAEAEKSFMNQPNNGNRLSHATIGGVAFGLAGGAATGLTGVVLGGLTAREDVVARIRSISVVLHMDDWACPIWMWTFLDHRKGVAPDSATVRYKVEQAQELQGELRALCPDTNGG